MNKGQYKGRGISFPRGVDLIFVPLEVRIFESALLG